MKNLLLSLALALALPAQAFTLISYSLTHAPQVVWYEAHGPVQGTVGTLSAYQPAVAAAVNTAMSNQLYERIKPLRLAMNITTAGVGAGNMTVEAYDSTSAASICSNTRVCSSTSFSVDCLGPGAVTAGVADTVLLRVDATACTNSPAGTIELSYAGIVADEGVDFVPRFIPWGGFGLDGGGSFFGLDSFQFDSITCGWTAKGVVSGGTDTMRVQLIQKSDAGVVCTCDLPGTCADAEMSEHTCNCGGKKYLTGVHALGQGYAIQWATATNCGLNPGNITCGIPFHQ